MLEFDIYKSIRAWVKTVCDVEAIKAREAAPRPTATKSGSLCHVPEKGLYVTMDITSDDEVACCGKRLEPCGDCFEEVTCTQYELIINLQSYRCGAYDLMRKLRRSLKVSPFDRNYLMQFGITDRGTVTNLRTFNKNLPEDRAALTITLSYSEETRRKVKCITAFECDPCVKDCSETETPEIEEVDCH